LPENYPQTKNYREFLRNSPKKKLALKKIFKSIFEVVVIIDSLNIASLEAWLLTGNTHQD
jgi:hypothetical protein